MDQQPPHNPTISFQPYLLRSMYEWIVDNGFTPYVDIDTTWKGVIAPHKYLQDGEVVFNVAPQAVRNLRIGNDAAEFDARFGEKVFHIYLPIGSVIGIFAFENNCGINFPIELREEKIAFTDGTILDKPKADSAKQKPKPSAHLRIIKSTKEKPKVDSEGE